MFDHRFDDFWHQLGSHLAPKMGSRTRPAADPHPLFSISVAYVAPSRHLNPFQTLFGTFLDRFCLNFGSPRHRFSSMSSPFLLRNSFKIATTRLSRRRTQIYGNSEIKIKLYKNICSHVRLDRSSLFDPLLNVRPGHKTPRPKMRVRR